MSQVESAETSDDEAASAKAKDLNMAMLSVWGALRFQLNSSRSGLALMKERVKSVEYELNIRNKKVLDGCF